MKDSAMGARHAVSQPRPITESGDPRLRSRHRLKRNSAEQDDIPLVLLYLTTFNDKYALRAWKSHDEAIFWVALHDGLKIAARCGTLGATIPPNSINECTGLIKQFGRRVQFGVMRKAIGIVFSCASAAAVATGKQFAQRISRARCAELFILKSTARLLPAQHYLLIEPAEYLLSPTASRHICAHRI